MSDNIQISEVIAMCSRCPNGPYCAEHEGADLIQSTMNGTDAPNTFQSIVSTVSRKVSQVAKSIPDSLHELEQLLVDLKIVNLVAHISHFLTVTSYAAKAAILYAIAQLYAPLTTSAMIEKLSGCYDEIATFFQNLLIILKCKLPSLFGMFKEEDKQNALFQKDQMFRAAAPNAPAEPMVPPQLADALGGEAIDVANGIGCLDRLRAMLPESFGQYLDENTTIIKCALGAFALLATICGLPTLMSFSTVAEKCKEMARLATTIKAGEKIASSVDSTLDFMMSSFYSLFGKTYFSPKAQILKGLAERISALSQSARHLVNQTKIDVFGVLKNNTHETLTTEYNNLMHQFQMLETTEKSLYNFQSELRTIWTDLEAIREVKFNIAKCEAGKQRPVTCWLAGTFGVGKTRFMTQLSRTLSARTGYSKFSRTFSDKFWSSYAGQGIVEFDDIGQNLDHEDHKDFHLYTGENQTDVIGAGIPDKGKPFVSSIILATANKLWFSESKTIQHKEALHRRRDFVIYFHFPALLAYKDSHNGAEPPSAWFATNAPLLYVVNPIYVSAAELPLITPQHPAYICTVTPEELVDAIVELEKERAEHYRSRLVGTVLLQEHITIPNEPIVYDATKYDYILGRVARLNPQAPAFVPPHQYAFVEESSDSEEENAVHPQVPQAKGVNPIKVIHTVRKNPLGLSGPAGCGKTYLITQCIETELHFATYIDGEEFPENKIVIFDDITTSHNRLDKFKDTLQLYEAGQLRIKSLIFTFNKNSHVWTAFPDDRDMIVRRCTIVDIDISFTTSIGLRMSQNTLEKYLEGKTSKERSAYLTVSFSGKPPPPEHHIRTYEALVPLINYYTNKEYKQNERIIVEDLMYTPMPTHCDILITAGFASDDFSSKCTELMSFFSLRAQTVKHGQVVSVNWLEYRSMFTTIAPFFLECAKTYASNFPSFVKSISNKKLKCPGFPHILLRFTDVTIGFISPDDTVIAYVVRPDDSLVALREGGVNITDDAGTVFVPFEEPESRKYLVALGKMFGQQRSPLLPVRPKVSEVEKSLFLDHKAAQLFKALAAGVGLAATSFCLVALLKPVLTSTEDDGEYLVEYPEKRGKKSGKATTKYTSQEDYDEQKRLRFLAKLTRGEISRAQYHKLYPDHKERRRDLDIMEEETVESFSDEESEAEEVIEKRSKAKTKLTTKYTSQEDYDEQKRLRFLGKMTRGEISKAKYYSMYPEARETNECLTPSQQDAYVNTGATPVEGDVCYHPIGDFGVYHNEHIYYAHESPNIWMLRRVPFVPDWQVIDPTSIDSFNTGKTTFKHRFVRVKTVDEAPLLALLNVPITKVIGDTCDYGSAIAFCFGYGVPFDIENGRIYLKALYKLFPKDSGRTMPVRLMQHLRKCHPTWVEHFETDPRPLILQGVQDIRVHDISKNLRNHMVELHQNGIQQVHGIMFKERYGITVSHVGTKGVTAIGPKGIDSPIRIIGECKKNDLMVFELTDKAIPAFKDITNYFVSDAELEKYVQRHPINIPIQINKYETDYFSIHNGSARANLSTKVNKTSIDDVTYSVDIGDFGYTGMTMPGDCGSPVLFINPTITGKIAAIHKSGSNYNSSGAIVTREILSQLIKGTKESRTEYVKRPNKEVIMTEPELCQHTGLTIVARPKKELYVPDTTTKYRTPLPLDTETEPTIMSTRDPRNPEQRSLLHEGLAKFAHGDELADFNAEIDYAKRSIANDLINKFNSRGLTLRKWTKTEAINSPSYEEFPSANSINRSGSAGAPYVQKYPTRPTKAHYLYQNPKDQQWRFRINDPPAQEISSHIDQRIVDSYRGISHMTLYGAYLKDECTKFAKIYDVSKRKTRVFFSCPFDFLIAYRMQFGSFLCRLTEIYDICPYKIGINAKSMDSHVLYYYLARPSDQGFAMDYKDYDSSICQDLMAAVADIINDCYQACDPTWKVEDNVSRATLHQAVEEPNVITGNTVFQMKRGHVSGDPGTATTNSLINHMIWVIVYMRLAKRNAPGQDTYAAFSKNVAVAFYGDDCIAGVAPGVLPWFNYNTFAIEVKKLGFIVTDAAKSGGAIPDSQPLSELEFIKRSFRHDRGLWLCPLNLASLNKQLTWISDRPSYKYRGQFHTTTNMALVSQSINTVFSEYALHGREVFDEAIANIRKACFGLNLELEIPTYEEVFRLMNY